MRLRTALFLVALAAFAVLPAVVHEGFYLDLLMGTFMYAAMAVGWDILGGYAGADALEERLGRAEGLLQGAGLRHSKPRPACCARAAPRRAALRAAECRCPIR